MPTDTSRLWEQVALGEDTDLELKEARFRGNRVSGPRRDDLADELAAFANARGGRLVLGVSDEPTAAGARSRATGCLGEPGDGDLFRQHQAAAGLRHLPGAGAGTGERVVHW